MAFDEVLADRVLAEVEVHADITTRKMFGGLAVMWRGNMTVCVVGADLLVRVGPEQYEELLGEPGAREMDFTGRPMRGMLFVAGDAVATGDELRWWVERATRFTGTLPAK